MFRKTMIALSAMVALTVMSDAARAQNPAAQESPWATRQPAASASSTMQSQVEVIHPSAATPSQRKFAGKFVKSVQAEDSAQIRELIAPTTLKCFDQSRQEFLNTWIKKQSRFKIPDDHKLSVSTLPPEMAKSSKVSTFPVRATHLMEFEYSTPDGSTITLNQMIGQEGGNWYLIPPCPTAEGLERFAKIQKIRDAGRIRAEQAYAKVQEPLKSQLLALIAKHDNASAWKLCISQLHVDFMTARAVVERLANEQKTD
jgi:hypothetical protein